MTTFIIFSVCVFLAWKGIFAVLRLLNNVDKDFARQSEQFSAETNLPVQPLWQREAEVFRLQNEVSEMKTRLKIGLVAYLAVVFLIGFFLSVSLERFRLFEDGLSFDSFFSAATLFVLGALVIGFLLLRIVLRLVGVRTLLFGHD